MKLSLSELEYEKLKLKEELGEKLSYERKEVALNDHHAVKPPVHCGLTVHSVVGCTFRCVYCYSPDMGFDITKAQPYALSGEEITYALLNNEFYLPGLKGTYLAFGSIGEPLYPNGLYRTFEYIETFSRLLRNPLQLSTKTAVSEEIARRLASISRGSLTPLVSAITLSYHHVLEPGAPAPLKRLEGIKFMRKAGLQPMLFLRPLLPGFEQEVPELLKKAKKYGATAVVLGSLRVTPSILARLKSAGVDIAPVLNRVKRELKAGIQLSVRSEDLKNYAVKEARKVGLVPLLSACCANTLNLHLSLGVRIPCMGLDFIDGRFCTRCPVGCEKIRVEVDTGDVKRAVKNYLKIEAFEVIDEGRQLLISVRNRNRARRLLFERIGYKRLLETAFRKRLVISEGQPIKEFTDKNTDES
ncbi:MAG: radical SAM protein [Thermofilaceae archaeon]